MITNKPSQSKIDSEAILLYKARKGASYCHHASIAHFKGAFYAIWSCGRVTEDDQGQQVMLSVSENGTNWSKPRTLVSPGDIGRPRGVLTAAGLYSAGEALNAYFGYYEYAQDCIEEGATRPKNDAHHQGTTLYVMRCDGSTWSEPLDMHIPIVPNHAPSPTHSGRLIISGNISFPYTDSPCGTKDYKISGIYGSYFDDKPYFDDSDAIWRVGEHNGWVQQGRLVCEGSFYQTDDDVIHMLLRTNTDRLWCTQSRDDGATWSTPFKTDFQTDASKFHFGRLPDGRFYAVGNFCFNGYKRDPLHLCLSSDGERFNTCYVLRDEPHTPFRTDSRKGGLYGYPHSLVHDGYLYVIYSKHKEDIEITRVRLKDIK
ncbi:MAG: exo-alpha-sialidase [Clostridia bacterium]|nr:exo-alpha-sialidase [Clostridia bacterium]